MSYTEVSKELPVFLACLTPIVSFGKMPFPNQRGAGEGQPGRPAWFTDVLVIKWGQVKSCNLFQDFPKP